MNFENLQQKEVLDSLLILLTTSLMVNVVLLEPKATFSRKKKQSNIIESYWFATYVKKCIL